MKLFFKIFRPLDPIVWDGSNISEYNIANKLYNFLKVTLIDFDISRYTLIELFYLVKGLIVTFFIIIYLPISALFYLFNYRFLWINTWQLGAYLQQLDCIIKENELRKNSKLIFLCPKFLLINNFTHKFYKRKLILIENFIIYILLYPCMHTFFLQKTNWEYETIKKKSKFNYLNFNYKKKYKKYFTVKTKLNNENFIKKKISAKLNVSNLNRVIVVQQRDEFFYKSPKTRNSNINNLYDSINFLLRLNFTVVRYKSSKSKSLNISNKSYQEFLINNDMDKLEQFILIKNCKLVICYQGGILGYDYICNTPFY